MANHHARNHKAYLANLRNRVLAYKIARGGCVDCGLPITADNHMVFDFDHRDPEHKRSRVSRLIRNHSWSTLVAEMEKCDLRCANCHRLRTHRERHCGQQREPPITTPHPTLWD